MAADAKKGQPAKADLSEKLFELARRRGFFYNSSEIYGGVSGLYDYGTTGTLLKRNIEDAWRKYFLGLNDNFYEIEAADIMPKNVFVASGHITNFVDPMVKCGGCGLFYRADHIVSEATGMSAEGLSQEQLNEAVKKNRIKCKKCGHQLGEVKVLNMMLPLSLGAEGDTLAYMRPETAQGVYVNFLRQFEILRNRLPMGLAIIGKAFRNEISPRQLLIRQREFTQAELQIFFDPEKVTEHERWDEVKDRKLRLLLVGKMEPELFTCRDANEKLRLPKFYVYHMAKVQEFFLSVLGFDQGGFRLRELSKEERAFYNKIHFDVEVYLKSFDEYRELGGVHYRTDHDLTGHQAVSKKTHEIFYQEKRFIPHVLELSLGVDRMVYGMMDHFYRDMQGREWEWMAFPARMAPFRFAVFPLVNKEGIPEKARQIFDGLKTKYKGIYDESGSIGKRYARIDEIGVPVGITVDFDTMKDGTVTIRDRDTAKQVRVKASDLEKELEARAPA